MWFPRTWRSELELRRQSALRRLRFLGGGSEAESRFRKHYFADKPVSLGSQEYHFENFPMSGPLPWLDRADAGKQIEARLEAGAITEAEAAQCRNWAKDGYVSLPGLFPSDFLDRVWGAYERARALQKVPLENEVPTPDDPHPPRSLDSHFAVPEVAEVLCHPALVSWSRLILGREVVPFQTLVSYKGSQQKAHSDSIHMTTYPPGYLCAAWVAFEDIGPDCGPLAYYPSSHRIPFLSSHALGISSEDFRAHGYAAYNQKYEPAIADSIARLGLAPAIFTAKKGDVLVWHANLIHAGTKRRNMALTRRSIVCHYFAAGAVCYHDLSGALARVSQKTES